MLKPKSIKRSIKFTKRRQNKSKDDFHFLVEQASFKGEQDPTQVSCRKVSSFVSFQELGPRIVNTWVSQLSFHFHFVIGQKQTKKQVGVWLKDSPFISLGAIELEGECPTVSLLSLRPILALGGV